MCIILLNNNCILRGCENIVYIVSVLLCLLTTNIGSTTTALLLQSQQLRTKCSYNLPRLAIENECLHISVMSVVIDFVVITLTRRVQ